MSVRGHLDVDALKTALAASQARVSAAEAQIASLTLMIEKLRRALYGQRSERKERLLDQLELALDDLTADAGEDDLAAEKAAAATTEVKGFVRSKPSRKPFPEHLPRERVVVPGPMACTCCGSERLSKIWPHSLRVFVRSAGDGGEQTIKHWRLRSGRIRNRGWPSDGITR